LIYEWDPKKAKANVRKHGLSFAEAASVFLDPLAVTLSDPDHSDSEEREITIGVTKSAGVIFVSHSRRGDRLRIISARAATRAERRQYEEGDIAKTR